MFFDDVKEFILLCYSNLALMPPSIFPISAAKLFVNICFILIAIHAVFYLINEINRYNKIKDFILRLSILSLVVYVIIYALYGGDTSYYLPLLITTPLSIILSGYFESNNDKYLSKGELVLLLCAAIVYRTSIFLI